MRLPLHIPSIIALMLPVTGIWLTSGKPSQVADYKRAGQVSHPDARVPAPVRLSTTRSIPRTAEALTADSVVMIGPDEWQIRFKTEYGDVHPEIRAEIVQLAAELRDSIDQGLDPKGNEANTFGETILALLDEKTTR